jgi:AcrR family transcriptional regulator
MQPLLTHSEREWILIGMAECCAGKGYEQTTADDICAAAGISSDSFARVFADKRECLDATMEAVVDEAYRALDDIRPANKAWPVRLHAGTTALLGLLAKRPAFAHVALVDVPIAGGRAALLHESSRAAFIAFVEQGRELGEPSIPASAARGALAGAEALVTRQILLGKAAGLAELVEDVVYMLAVPFLGIGEAHRLAAGPARRGHLRAVA